MRTLIKRYREPIFVVALLAIPFAIFFAKAKKGRDPTLLDRAIISLIALIAAVVWELHVPNPIVNLRLLKERNFAFANFLMLILGFVLLGSTALSQTSPAPGRQGFLFGLDNAVANLQHRDEHLVRHSGHDELRR